jgi:hypothetical protein
MKRLFWLGIFFLIQNLYVQAQDLNILFSSGNNIVYGLATVEKVTFSSTDMQIHLIGGTTQNYPMSTIRYFNYQPTITDIEETKRTQLQHTINVVPNPCTGITQLRYTLDKAQIRKLSVYNLQGQKLWTNSKRVPAGLQQEELNLQKRQFSSGIYLVEIQTQYKRFIAKVILQ